MTVIFDKKKFQKKTWTKYNWSICVMSELCLILFQFTLRKWNLSQVEKDIKIKSGIHLSCDRSPDTPCDRSCDPHLPAGTMTVNVTVPHSSLRADAGSFFQQLTSSLIQNLLWHCLWSQLFKYNMWRHLRKPAYGATNSVILDQLFLHVCDSIHG